MDIVRPIMMSAIVPKYVNFERSLEDLVARKSQISHIIFDNGEVNTAHLMLDGTYIYIEKCARHGLTKRIFSQTSQLFEGDDGSCNRWNQNSIYTHFLYNKKHHSNKIDDA